MNLLEAINRGWSWAGLNATEVHAQSPMGHLLVSDQDGCYHYIDTDMMELHSLGDEVAARAHFALPETREIWEARRLVELARERLGDPPEGHVFALQIHAMIEGRYSVDDICFLPLTELVFVSGDIAKQMKDLPDGSQIRIEIVD